MNWFWLNVPLEIVFFAAWTGIPLWLVLRRPGWGPGTAGLRHRRQAGHQARPPRPPAADGHEHQHAEESRVPADARG